MLKEKRKEPEAHHSDIAWTQNEPAPGDTTTDKARYSADSIPFKRQSTEVAPFQALYGLGSRCALLTRRHNLLNQWRIVRNILRVDFHVLRQLQEDITYFRCWAPLLYPGLYTRVRIGTWHVVPHAHSSCSLFFDERTSNPLTKSLL